ncbi:hypothetical protein GOP47_0028856 [Adiantum capillus-veneris]|nr:hypothetical protein GOP47_0028856 [Adiantum capillus-veneris]
MCACACVCVCVREREREREREIMLVDSNTSPSRTRAMMPLPDHDQASSIAKHEPGTCPNVMDPAMRRIGSSMHLLFSAAGSVLDQKSSISELHERRPAESIGQLDKMAPAGTCTQLINSASRKRQRCPTMRLLAVAATCSAMTNQSRISPSPSQPYQPPSQAGQQELLGLQVQKLQCRSDKWQLDCDAEYSTAEARRCASPGIRCSQTEKILQNGKEQQYEGNYTQKEFCISPTNEAGRCRQMIKVELTCPPPPSKPASKPKRLVSSIHKKKFFVPSNLTELPPALQSLFT